VLPIALVEGNLQGLIYRSYRTLLWNVQLRLTGLLAQGLESIALSQIILGVDGIKLVDINSDKYESPRQND
jgi:hypothetical protein